jgi:imidazolonepropionase-like amidohydrolase
MGAAVSGCLFDSFEQAWKGWTTDHSTTAHPAPKWSVSFMRICLAFLIFVGSVSAFSQPSSVALTHVNVVDVRSGSVARDQTVLIADGRISAVSRSGSVHIPGGVRILDGQGDFLIPGLWDMHVHTDGDRRALQMMLAAGITGIRDMGGDVHKLINARHNIEAGDWDGPRVIFAGPLLDGPPGDSDSESWVVRTPEEARRVVVSLAVLHVNFIKVHDRLARDVYFTIAATAKREELPFAGHVPGTISPVEASDAGQASIEHFEFVPKQCLPVLNAMVVGENPGLKECTHESFDALFEHFAKNGTWLVPTIQSFRYFAPAQWTQILANFSELGGQMRNAHVQMMAGTDWSDYLESKGAHPGGCLHDELGIWVDAGFTPVQALQASAVNPALFLGMQDSLGSVKKGYIADLVLLKDNPLLDIRNTTHIVAVVARGKVYDHAALIGLGRTEGR